MAKKKVLPTDKIFAYDGHKNVEFVCGVDEAGRGPLAGPVVCSACIMDRNIMIDGIYDSKKVSEKERERLFDEIKSNAIAYSIVALDQDIIDDINILEATKKAMCECILSLSVRPDAIIVDAVKGLSIGREYDAIVKGDETSYAVASASILAKVTRDRIMCEYAKEYPQYGFEKHKGYGTAMHIQALKQYGKTAIHRTSFIKKIMEN